MAESNCEIKNAIGGYFELADYEEGLFPHPDGVLLNTGRNALEYILRSIGEVNGVYLPYYTCEVVLEPLKKLHIPWMYYHINARFEIADEIHPQKGEFIIANNYYGIKDAYIHTLADQFGDHLIVDCAQAFFARPIKGIKAFYSPRKFVGVADGGVAYLGNVPDGRVPVREMECTEDHDSHLYKRKQFDAETGFSDFKENEVKLCRQPIRLMSHYTKHILDHIDYDKVIDRRRANYLFFHDRLADNNVLKIALDNNVVPMVYPYLTDSQDLKHRLISERVYVATYWPNVMDWVNEGDWEHYLISKLCPIPIDQRYDKKELERIISIIER